MNANWLRSENHARMTYHACDSLIARATYVRTYARMCGEGICAWRIELGEPPARHHAKPIAPRTNNHVTNMCTYVRTYKIHTMVGHSRLALRTQRVGHSWLTGFRAPCASVAVDGFVDSACATLLLSQHKHDMIDRMFLPLRR